MEFRIISLPPFRAASSGPDPDWNFAPEGRLGQFHAWFSTLSPQPRDAFMPRNFLYFDEARNGAVWIWALAEGMEDGGHEILELEGGLYLTYAYRDGDETESRRLYQSAMRTIRESDTLDFDIRPNHYPMGHIITPPEVIQAQGWSQMETFIPVKLK